jgi:hypothetical protein
MYRVNLNQGCTEGLLIKLDFECSYQSIFYFSSRVPSWQVATLFTGKRPPLPPSVRVCVCTSPVSLLSLGIGIEETTARAEGVISVPTVRWGCWRACHIVQWREGSPGDACVRRRGFFS